MSAENLATVRRIYDGWASGEIAETLGSLMDPRIDVYPDPESAWPGIEPSYHGYEGISRYLTSIYSAFEGYRAEPEDLIDAGDRVLVLAIDRGRGRFSGAPVGSDRPRTDLGLAGSELGGGHG